MIMTNSGRYYVVPDDMAEKTRKYDQIVEILAERSPYNGNREICDMIREIVGRGEKQMPKKPIGHWGDFCDIFFTCPICARKVRKGCKTCKCGQSINWGEGEQNDE